MTADSGRARRLTHSLGELAALVVIVAAVAVALGLGSRTAPVPDSSTGASASPWAIGVIEPSTSPTNDPTATASVAATPGPTPHPTSAPTPQPTADPTAAPTARPTPKSTPRPTTKPTPDPRPEGTPRITAASGAFGQTLTVQGIKVRVDRAAARDGTISCTTDDPDRQGWTELVSYELRMTWPDAGDAEEPWVAVGKQPWNVLQFDGPSPFKSGADYVVSTCHKPDDSDKVKVEISPPGSPLIYLRWSFS